MASPRRLLRYEAVQWTVDNADEVARFCGDLAGTPHGQVRPAWRKDPILPAGATIRQVQANSHGQWLNVYPKDWIVRTGIGRGQFTVLRPEQYQDWVADKWDDK